MTMNYIPQEAKEQIAKLMADIDRLESQKVETLDELDNIRVQNISNIDKANTIRYALFAVIVLLLVGIGYIYMNGSVSGINEEDKKSQELYVKNIEKENVNLKNEIEELKLNGGGDTVIKPDLLYKVQIGAFKSFALKSFYQEKDAIIENNESGFTKYSLGSFTKHKDALVFLKEVRQLGFKKAFVVAEYKGERISIKESKKLEK